MNVQRPAGRAAAQAVFLIRPRMGGFANDLTVQEEGGEVLYHVKAKILSPLGRKYSVYDQDMVEFLSVDQDHTTIFPHFTVFQQGEEVARLGQGGVIPQNYFLQLNGRSKAELYLGVFDSIFNLHRGDDVVAEIAQHRSTWIVVLPRDRECVLVLAGIAVIYRLNMIGG